jgi:hypothetical protein
MEEEYFADRALLRRLMQTHPDWTQQEYAAQTGRSLSWVKKWRQRLRAAAPNDQAVLHSRSRARKAYHQWDARVIERIVAIREQPPEGLRRTPGPQAILYYLWRDSELGVAGLELPRSRSAVWRILDRCGCIARRTPAPPQPVERPSPLTSWQLDFKDASTVPADPAGGKRQHVVEVLNTVDVGTSLLLEAYAGDDYTAATSLARAADLVRAQGLPAAVTFDRDPRFVGSPHGRDFPSPFVRFWMCLGVSVTICPPHHPQTNAFVERYHRSYNQECLRVERPGTLEAVRLATAAYKEHYNWQRPNQARSCGNQPPRVAFPALPARPPAPLVVDPDAWLRVVDGRAYVRRVRENGTVPLDTIPYYIDQRLVRQAVALVVDVAAGEFAVIHHGQEIKRLPIKGCVNRLLTFDDFVDLLLAQTRDDERSHRVRSA